ncbi:MAG: ATP-binding protein [Desulfosporosinus sp.]|nr:ATP-binding protein [Desulfosporosinus sp.]
MCSQNRRSTVFIVCGPCGAGKTSYSINLNERYGAIRFSLDSWMQILFAPDLIELNFDWISERTKRCRKQIWQIVKQLIKQGINVVLDFGFGQQKIREFYRKRAMALGADVSIHYLDIPKNVRRQRVHERNQKREPEVFAFEVTDSMFDFMENSFEVPDEEELSNGIRVVSTDNFSH